MTRTAQETAVPTADGWKRRVGLLSSVLGVLALALAVRFASPPKQAEGAPKAKLAPKKIANAKKTAKTAAHSDDSQPHELVAPEKPSVVAVVNGQPISRNELAQECLKHFGDDVLKTLVNKQLIVEHCKARKITVTHEEVRAEIERMAQRFGLPSDQLLKMLKEERHITPDQYAKEIIWPTVALKKLAKERLKVSDKEIKEAYEMLYGPAVQTRLIACETAAAARDVRALALENPDNFANLAKKHSIDVSASSSGRIQPIHKHEGNLAVERAAFSLKVGEISDVIQIGNQYVILQCEARLAAQFVPMKDVRARLVETIQDSKLRQESDDLFAELEKQADFQDVFNDPAKRKKHPGVAALINGQEITMRELAEECVERNGIETLEGMINRRLLEQACKRKKIEISEADMQAEIARAALAMGKTKMTRKGEVADVDAWLKDVQENQKLTLEIYRDQNVWPSAALKKLVGKDVEISDEDMQKSYQANYGPRVKCRAIVFDRERKAQEIWTRLRGDLSLEKFAEAAGTYSVDQGSHEAQGQIPPIAKFGTDPHMEKEAFALHAGEMSGVIQVGDKFVILFCEGFTKPTNTNFEEVKREIIADLREKKLRVAMARQYTKLSDTAQIDNYLTGVSKSPEKGNPVDQMLGATGLLANPEPAKDNAGGKPVRKPVKTAGRPKGGTVQE
ncbi:MAG TPA: peptidyl-prolyl cis-trans isomerase [Pirellulales bacterium]|nr:peptidyl-prolyl cis-trans isomerase [Pirellulales bacterium]